MDQELVAREHSLIWRSDYLFQFEESTQQEKRWSYIFWSFTISCPLVLPSLPPSLRKNDIFVGVLGGCWVGFVTETVTWDICNRNSLLITELLFSPIIDSWVTSFCIHAWIDWAIPYSDDQGLLTWVTCLLYSCPTKTELFLSLLVQNLFPSTWFATAHSMKYD